MYQSIFSIIHTHLKTEQTDVVVDKASSAENLTSESSIENSINDTPEQAESSSSMEDKDSESMSEVTDKLQYTRNKKRKLRISLQVM